MKNPPRPADRDAKKVNDLHRRIVAADASALALKIECGERLLKKKAELGHGLFMPWVRVHCEFSHKTGNRYMMCAEFVRSNSSPLSNLDSTDPPSQGRIEAAARQHAREQSRKQLVACETEIPAEQDIDLHVCHFRDLPVPPAAAQLVILDPPWDNDTVVTRQTYAAAAEKTAEWLSPSGFALVYVPHHYLPQVIEQAGRHLRYMWPFTIVYPVGSSGGYAQNLIKTHHRLVLLYTVPGRRTPHPPGAEWVRDVFQIDPNFDRNEKSWHAWEQNPAPIRHWIGRLARAGSLIVDPFLGGGTTAAVVKELGRRRFIGGDIDADAVAATRKRLRTITPGAASESAGRDETSAE